MALLDALPHSKVIDVGAKIVGLVVSSIVNVAEVVLVLPQASLTVNMTVALPVPPHPLLRPVKLLLHVNSLPQAASVATAPPWVFNQLMSASLLPFPSHGTVRFAAAVAMIGAVSVSYTHL